MTQKFLIYPKPDGGVAIVIPTDPGLDAAGLAELAAATVPAGVEYRVVDQHALPRDRRFRDAWEYSND